MHICIKTKNITRIQKAWTYDIFCSRVTLGIENCVLRTRRLVIGQSEKAQLNARLRWPDNYRRLMRSMRSQLSGELRCHSISALQQTENTYIHKHHLTWHGNICCSLQYIYSEQIDLRGVNFTHTHIHHCYINLCSKILRRETNWNMKLKFCLYFCRARSVLDILGSLITCLFSNKQAIALSVNLLISDPELQFTK